MTIRIGRSRWPTPWHGALRVLIIAVIVILICLILLGLISGFIVDWLWFSTVGYRSVFWTTIVAEAVVFFSVFVATAIILWINGWFAFRFAQPQRLSPSLNFERKFTGSMTLPEILEFMRGRLSWHIAIPVAVSFLAVLVAWGEVENWRVLLRFIYQIPYGASDPLFNKDIGFYLFTLPAYIAIKNWMFLVLSLSALVAGAIYWVLGEILYDVQRKWISPAAISHGSLLLGLFLHRRLGRTPSIAIYYFTTKMAW